MAVRRIKHLSKGYAALLVDEAWDANLEARASRLAEAAGGEADGFIVPPASTPRKRARRVVVALHGDPDNKLIRNLDAGR